MPHRLTIERLALFGTLLATFGELHPACDHWAQGSKTASRKRLYGEDLVHADGTPAAQGSTRPAMTTSTLGRRAVACHVASYTAVQVGATIAVTRAFGYRVTPAALLAGAAINASTHAAIDRGALLLWLAKKTGQSGYIEHCQAVRLAEDGTVTREVNGPGTAWMELDVLCTNVESGQLNESVDAKGRQLVGFDACRIHPVAAGAELENGAVCECPDLSAQVGGVEHYKLASGAQHGSFVPLGGGNPSQDDLSDALLALRVAPADEHAVLGKVGGGERFVPEDERLGSVGQFEDSNEVHDLAGPVVVALRSRPVRQRGAWNHDERAALRLQPRQRHAASSSKISVPTRQRMRRVGQVGLVPVVVGGAR